MVNGGESEKIKCQKDEGNVKFRFDSYFALACHLEKVHGGG